MNRALADVLERNSFSDTLDAWADGTLRPKVMKTYPLEEAAAALGEIAGRRVVGKLVFEP